MNCRTPYKEINQEEATNIIENRKPKGLFFLIEDGLYIGIDNLSGDAWTEEFKEKGDCFNWLLDIEIECV